MTCEAREAPDAREADGAARQAGRAGLTQDVALAALAVALHQVGVALLSSSYHASVQCTGSFVVSLALAVALYLVVTHRPRAIADGPWALAGVLADVPFASPAIPVWANATGEPYPTGADEARALLASQVAHPVRWTKTLAGLSQAGVDTFVEVGPGHVLTGLVKRTLPGARAFTCETPQDVEAVLAELGLA